MACTSSSHHTPKTARFDLPQPPFNTGVQSMKFSENDVVRIRQQEEEGEGRVTADGWAKSNGWVLVTLDRAPVGQSDRRRYVHPDQIELVRLQP